MQLVHATLQPKKLVCVASRATGKSNDKGMRQITYQKAFPRGTGVMAGATYAQLLTITLTPLLGFLEKNGYYRDEHYVLGTPPEDWPNPYELPADFSRAISFKNGYLLHLSSQDRVGGNRGRNVDVVSADEVLTLNKQKFEDETLASNRGNLKYFGNHHLHHGFDLHTSMPVGSESQWILDYAKYYLEDGYDIWHFWNRLCHLYLEFIRNDGDAKLQRDILEEIKIARKDINFYVYRGKDKKRQGLLFTLFNVFDNIQNVGIDYVMMMYSQMTELSFRLEILNERILQVLDGFYKINTAIHTYAKYNDSFVDKISIDAIPMRSSLWDGDVNELKALDLSIDYGDANITALSVSQEVNSMEYRYLKSMYVKHPKTLEDVLKDFCDYYAFHKNKKSITGTMLQQSDVT